MKLSCDDLPDYGKRLADVCRWVEEQGGKLDGEALRDYPSILFGLETAIRHFFEGTWALWNTAFSRGEAGIPINGLIWMGDFDKMLVQTLFSNLPFMVGLQGEKNGLQRQKSEI